MKVWNIFPSLPMGFWTKEALKVTANNIGTFASLEPNWASKKYHCWDWVRVEVNVREGLVRSIDLVMGDITWHRKVDYWKIPFRFHGCHEIEHLWAKYERLHPERLPPPKVWRRKKTTRRTRVVEALSINGKKEIILIDLGKKRDSSSSLGDLVL